jgi:hypothetical protein
MNRTGLGRHGRLDDAAGDPLDGLVNLFDIGIVLAVAFLIAGISVAPKVQGEGQKSAGSAQQAIGGRDRVLPDITTAPKASGHGDAVGKVYRLPDGRLVLVESGR